jgi:hypothetical protein
MKECDMIGQLIFLYLYFFQLYFKVLPHIRAIWYTDFGKLILISKTKAREAMDFSFTVIFGTMCTYFACTYCDSSDFRQTCSAYFTSKNNTHR